MHPLCHPVSCRRYSTRGKLARFTHPQKENTLFPVPSTISQIYKYPEGTVLGSATRRTPKFQRAPTYTETLKSKRDASTQELNRRKTEKTECGEEREREQNPNPNNHFQPPAPVVSRTFQNLQGAIHRRGLAPRPDLPFPRGRRGGILTLALSAGVSCRSSRRERGCLDRGRQRWRLAAAAADGGSA